MPAKPFDWMKWNFFVATLTAASFVPVSMFSVIVALGGIPPFFQFLGFAAFGLLQGALIGFGQALALRNTNVSVPGKQWIMASTLGAGALWVVGQIPGYFVTLDYANIFVIVGTLIVAFVFLGFFGLVQWRILKHRVRQAWRWVVITVYSWMAGLLVFVLGGLLIRNSNNMIVVVFSLTIFGTLAVIVIAMLSGYGMQLLAKDAIANPRYGTILPNTPKFNAAKRHTARVSARARAQGEVAARAAAAKAAPVVKKAADKAAPVAKKAVAKAAPVAKKAGSATSSAVKKTAAKTTSAVKKAAPKMPTAKKKS